MNTYLKVIFLCVWAICPIFSAVEEAPTTLAKTLLQSFRDYSSSGLSPQPIQFSQIGNSEKFLIQVDNPIFTPNPGGEGFELKPKSNKWIFIVIWPNQNVPEVEDYRKIPLSEGAVFVEKRNVSFKGNNLLIQILCPQNQINEAFSVLNGVVH